MRSTDLTSLVSPIVAGCGLELDRLEVQQAGRRALVRIYLDGDGADGRGPSLDDIAEATAAISAALDASPLPGNQPYTLEVSSRGVGRPLTEPKHYRRNIGRLVTLTMDDGSLTGRIVGVGDEGVTLDLAGIERVVPIATIRRAVVQVELNRIIEAEDEEP